MQTNNKYGTHRWGTVLFLLVVLFIAGCTKEDGGTDNNVITFNCSTQPLNTAKAIVDEMQYFRVSAMWDRDGAGYVRYINNQLVEKQGDVWGYSPVKHWPGYGKLSFFAHTPATSSGIDLIYIDSSTNEISIEYSVSTDHKKQEDFMAATNLDKEANPVQLKFEHLLSMATFQARSNFADTIYRIREIKITNINSDAIVTGVPFGEISIWGWYNHHQLTNYIVYQKYPFETPVDNYGEVGRLMVIPQAPVAASKIVVTYNVIGSSVPRIHEYPFPSGFTFEKGKKYAFFLRIGGQSGSKSSKQDSPEISWEIVSEPM